MSSTVSFPYPAYPLYCSHSAISSTLGIGLPALAAGFFYLPDGGQLLPVDGWYLPVFFDSLSFVSPYPSSLLTLLAPHWLQSFILPYLCHLLIFLDSSESCYSSYLALLALSLLLVYCPIRVFLYVRSCSSSVISLTVFHGPYWRSVPTRAQVFSCVYLSTCL